MKSGIISLKQYSIRYLVLLCLTICLTQVEAQEKLLVKGIVLDSASLDRLPYVNVTIKNSFLGTAADSRGSFALNANLGDTLTFSMIGYKELEHIVISEESLLIRLAERPKILESVTIEEISIDRYYRNLFEGQFRQLEKSRRKAPFYLSKSKKEQRYLAATLKEYEMAKVFIEYVATNEELKKSLMQEHDLNEEEYYDILRAFNEKSYTFMYYLSAPELLSVVKSFFAKATAQTN